MNYIRQTHLDRSFPATAQTPAQVRYEAVPGQNHSITGVQWSYDKIPQGGRLTIEDGEGEFVHDLDISSRGPGFLLFGAHIVFSENRPLIITLSSGGQDVFGRLIVTGHDAQPPWFGCKG